MAVTDAVDPKTAPEPAPADKAARAEQRKARLARLAEANKITLILQGDVRKAIAAQARGEGMDINHFIQKIVEDHIVATHPEDDPLARRLAARRGVIEAAVTRARELDADGRFDAHFIRTVMQSLAADPGFSDLYKTAISAEDPGTKRADRARVSLNQQLGRLIKRAAGAKSKRDAKGTIQRAQVEGELITSYTLLVKPG